ncbi:MAG: DUF433 domain-containing protein [Nitrospirae bacterium]|nr:DUF433 domain-containing protein [Nitrospirota bacterium]MBI3392932.1 DUF433 domain-containing protein [Nitrospirota bacterium]
MSATVQKSLRIPSRTATEIERIARESGREFSAVANELFEEALCMHRCPGIVFAEGTTGRRARVAGTGIEVWEIVATYRSVKEDWKRLLRAYDWLTEPQIRAAIGYYRAFPQEIERLVRQNEELTPEFVRKRFPSLS